MKAIKVTIGTIATLDKVFGYDIPVEVTQEDADYLKSVFGDTFKFDDTEVDLENLDKAIELDDQEGDLEDLNKDTSNADVVVEKKSSRKPKN